MKIVFILTMFFAVASANAEVVFAPAASYFKIEDESNGTTSELEISNYDLKLGFVDASGLYLGGMYQMSKLNNDNAFAVGPTLGFSHYSGFYALFTYFLVAEQDNGANSTFTDGMGPQIDLGWIFPLTSSFFIGPQISYRSISYEKQDTAGVSTDVDFTRTNILPYISLWFRF